MEFRLLGPVAVIDGGREVTVRQRRQRALLALLLLHVGETISVDRLLEELWGGDAPRTALASLHNAVSQLRRLVGADVLVTRPPGYALEIEPGSLDSVRFEQLLEEAQAARSVQDHGTAAVVLGEALALWRGPALADLAYEPFAQSEIRRLEELRQTALEERIEADLARGRHEDVVPELERLVGEEPLRERLHGQLMLALYRSGRQADALAAYRAARQTLVDELGIEPGPDLRQLEQAVLRQDDSLLLPGATPIATAAPMQFRRLATILFADVAAVSTEDEELDPETFHRLLGRYADMARAVLARHGGWVDRVAGDALMAAFGAQAADERHALRAASAALDLRAAVASMNHEDAALGTRLELRVGLASGEVLVAAPQARQQFVTGEAVRVAAGLVQAAGSDDIVVGPLAQRLLGAATLEPLGELELRARPKPVAAFRLVDLAVGETAAEQRFEAPLVGRKRELKTLRAALRDSRKDGAVRAVCVLGPAGIGKSRLARELAAVRGWDVLAAACPSFGDGITYFPLRRLVNANRDEIRAVLDGDPEADTAADRLVRLDGPAPEISWAFRRWCEARARRRPLLLVVDDLHWAEPTFLDLLDHLAEHATGPIVLLGLAREELVEERPAFLDAAPRAERIVLEGLATSETEALVDHLLAGAPLPADALGRVFETAEGNPLFVEQLIALAAEGDPLAADRPLPETIQALLATRLDRLGPGERAVLERASVVGREFTSADVTTLLDPEAVPTARRHLSALGRRGFIRPHREGEWRFGHVLLQEATYRAAPKALRANLHERYADALDRADDAPDVIVGTHLERAYRLRTELGPPDRAALRIAEDAGRRLGAAGMRALQGDDVPAASNLLTRAASLLPETDTARLGFLCELGGARKRNRDEAGAAAVLAEAARLATSAGDTRLRMRAQIEQAWPELERGTIGAAEVLGLLEQAIRLFEDHGDSRGLARAWHLTAAVRSLQGHMAATQAAAERAIVNYRDSGIPPTGPASLVASAAYLGPEPVDCAISRCEALASSFAASPEIRVLISLMVAPLEAMRSDTAAARELLRRYRVFFEERGLAVPPDVAYIAGVVEALAGNFSTAENILCAESIECERDGNWAWLATLSNALGEARHAQGRFDDSYELAEKARAVAPPDDLFAQIGWRRLRAKGCARMGLAAESESLAREAIVLLGRTDMVSERGAALVDLAEVLWLIGRADETAEVANRGIDLMRRKGNVAGAEHALARLGALADR